MIVGVDEAGVGPAFGSLWASAVCIPRDVTIPKLADSKRMSERRRQAVRETILSSCLVGLGEVTCHEIDTRGLGDCRRLVFHRALDDLMGRHPDLTVSKIIVDGTLFEPYGEYPYECIPRADATVAEVSAASVMAKTTRDMQVVAMCEENPSLERMYGIRRNKGYLSREHVDGIRKYGYTDHHRRSYQIRALHENA